MVTKHSITLRTSNVQPANKSASKKASTIQEIDNVMTKLGNIYIDNGFEYDNEELWAAMSNNVRWLKVTDCGSNGIESKGSYHTLEIIVKPENTDIGEFWNRKRNPIPVLTVKPSLFPGGGKGLFSAAHLPKNYIITFMIGKVRSYEECKKKENGFLFKLRGEKQKVLDPILHKKNKLHNTLFLGAHYINDKSFENENGRINYNAQFDGIFVRTIVDIRKGSEIYINYNKFNFPSS
jgi:hypothetical protein